MKNFWFFDWIAFQNQFFYCSSFSLQKESCSLREQLYKFSNGPTVQPFNVQTVQLSNVPTFQQSNVQTVQRSNVPTVQQNLLSWHIVIESFFLDLVTFPLLNANFLHFYPAHSFKSNIKPSLTTSSPRFLICGN